jgi:hypothetical protein
MIYPDRGEEWIDEECAPDSFPMAQPNLAAEASANRFSAAGGTGVVLVSVGFTDPARGIARNFLHWRVAISQL